MDHIEHEMKAWDRVLLARHTKRPTSLELIEFIFPDFLELHGDRLYGDDSALVCGLATLNNQPVTVIAQEKGNCVHERIKRNFGMPHPEGYRKALRLMKQAEKFNRPVIFIIDTPGAYPGVGAEERGQATAIAVNLAEMMTTKVPLISVVLSEGGSGGALAIGVSDKVFMFENAIYSILSPEGFASILYKDSSLASKAADDMKLTAQDLHQYGIIDRIIVEDPHGLHCNSSLSFNYLKEQLSSTLEDLQKQGVKQLLKARYDKYRKIGQFAE
jgi:acetyl-CoA carboxylase carboxyl transferase subunit alpha